MCRMMHENDFKKESPASYFRFHECGEWHCDKKQQNSITHFQPLRAESVTLEDQAVRPRWLLHKQKTDWQELVTPEEEAGLPEMIPSEVQTEQPEGFVSEEEANRPELITTEEDAGRPYVVKSEKEEAAAFQIAEKS